MAYTSSKSPETSVVAPGMSRRRSPPRLRCPAWTARRAPPITVIPIGTLMKNTARHPSALVSAPPNSTPAAMPVLPMAPQTARAVCRCRPA